MAKDNGRKDLGRKRSFTTRSSTQQQAIAAELLRHPIRTRILGWLAGEAQAHSQREIGKALSLTTAAVHYHLKLLEGVGLVRLEKTRPGPNGITEKLYSARPEDWGEARVLDARGKTGFYLDYTLACTQEMQREGSQLCEADPEHNGLLAGCLETYATPEEVRELKKRLLRLLLPFFEKHKTPTDGARPLAITFGLFRSKAAGWRGAPRVLDMLGE
jgi:hypothetical protein